MEHSSLTDKIEDYLKGRMPEAERLEFEQQIATDTSLADSVRLYQDLIGATNEPDIQSLRATMSGLADEFLSADRESTTNISQQPMKSIFVRRQFWLAIAASFALLVAAYYWMQRSPLSGEDLFAANFEAPDYLSTTQNRGSVNVDAVFSETESAYKNKDYNKVIELTSAALATGNLSESDRDDLLRSQGVTYLCLKQGAAAENAFNLMRKPVKKDIAWLMALSLLVQPGKEAAAKTAFEPFANDASSPNRQQKAQAILKELNRK